MSGEFFIFQQNNARVYRARETISFLACNFAKIMLTGLKILLQADLAVNLQ